MTIKTHLGSCHCGAVKYEVDVDLSRASRCNCTICTKVASVGALVKPDAFRLLAGESELSTYIWGHKVSQRYFCKVCGIHCFGKGHLEMLGGDFVSINANTLDDLEVQLLPLGHWDGRHNNWEAGLRETPWAIFAA